MRRFKDFIQENTEKHGVLAVGRLNPPTTGHAMLVNKVHEVARQHNAIHQVIISHSHDPKKNPLPPDQKLKHAKRFFPHTNIAVSSKEKPTLMHHLSDMYNSGVTHLHMVGDGPRSREYLPLIHKYNDKAGPHGYYNFQHIEAHSAGERNSDAQDITAMSASLMRHHASQNNFAEFRKGIPPHVSDAHARELFHHVRQGMKIKEDLNLKFSHLLSEGVYDQGPLKAVFLGGGPGSGKDYVLGQTLNGHGLTEINSDNALEYLMDKEHLDKKMPDSEEAQRNAIRKRAKNVTELRQRLAIHGRNGLIINGTADDPKKVAEIKKRLERLGYETKMLMVHTKDEVSQARNVERGQRGGRTVPEEIRTEKWKAVQAAKPEHAKLFGADYHEFDNSEDLRTAPPEVVKAKKEELQGLFKTVREFTKKPVQSEIAKKWIANQLQKRDTQPISKEGSKELPPHGSNAAAEAQKNGLQYYGVGRYGKNGRVTHRTVHDSLVDVSKIKAQQPQKISKKRPSKFKSKSSTSSAVTPEARSNLQKIRKKAFTSSVTDADRQLARERAKSKGRINEEFDQYLNEAVSITIAADTAEDIKNAFRLFVNNRADNAHDESYELSDSSAYQMLTLGKKLKEDKNVSILKESISEEKSGYAASRRVKDTRIRESFIPRSRSDYRLCDSILTEEAARKTPKNNLEQIWNGQKEKWIQKESIDDKGGLKYGGLSMADAGDGGTTGERIRKKTGKASSVVETIGAGGEDINSMAASVLNCRPGNSEQQLNTKKTWKARRPMK